MSYMTRVLPTLRGTVSLVRVPVRPRSPAEVEAAEPEGARPRDEVRPPAQASFDAPEALPNPGPERG